MKKHKNRFLCFFLIILIFMTSTPVAFADTISDLKKKTQQDEKQLDEINSQIDELANEQDVIKEEMENLQAEIIDIMTSISILEDELTSKKLEVEQVKLDLQEAIIQEQDQYESMKIRIKYMYEGGANSIFDALFSSTSMTELLNRADYIEELHESDQRILAAYQEARQRTEELKEDLEIEQSELEAEEAECEEERIGMEEALAQLKSLSSDYEMQISKAKQQALVYKKQIQQQNEKIAKLEAEAKRKAEEEAKKKAAQAQKAVGTAKVDKAAILAANGSDRGKEIAIYACGFVGNPYVWGGTSLTNGTDCSGFTQSVYKAYGYSIPRTSYMQRSAGKEVSYEDAQPGDLICYAGHVAMYIGNGKIVHAASAKLGIIIGNATYKNIITVRRIV